MTTRSNDRDIPLVLLVIGVVESIVLLLNFGSGLSFFQDEWDFLLHRGGFNPASFLTPDNEHISVIPAAIYKTLLAWFGMASSAPYRVVAAVLLATVGILVFAFLRDRVGDWLALFAALLVLFLGPAWQTMLFPVEMARVGSLAAGIGMLLVLRRRGSKADRLACGLLTVSVLFFSLGVSFIAAAAVDVARRPDRRRRAFVPAIPLAIYVLWYLGYGDTAGNHVTLHNVVTAPVYLLNGAAAAFQSLLGLLPSGALQADHPTWGWAILALVVVAAIVRLRRGGPLGPQLFQVGAAAATTWLLGGLTYLPGREATQSRYQYTGVVFTLLLLAELFPGIRPRRAVLAAAAVVTALALFGNISTLSEGRDYVRGQTNLQRADLGAIEVARDTVSPTFVLTSDIAGTAFLSNVDPGSYLSAVDTYGSPAFDERVLATAPEIDRGWADVVLAHALPVTLQPGAPRPAPAPAPVPAVRTRESAASQGSCIALASGGAVRLRSPTAYVTVLNGPSATLRLRRFSTGDFPFKAGTVTGGSSALLAVPADRSPRPWHLEVTARQPVRVCGSGSA